MRHVLLFVLAGLILCVFPGCDAPRPEIPGAPVSGPPVTAEDPVLKDKIGGLEKQLQDALKARDAAVASGNRLDALQAAKDASVAEAALYRQKAAELDAYGATLDKQIRQEREAAAQVKLWIAAGILLVAGGVALGLGLWWQMKRLIIGGIVGLGLSAACVTLAFLVPYAIWIGSGVLLIGVVTLLVFLIRRHVALDQLVGAIEARKPVERGDDVAITIPSYAKHFAEHLDTASEAIIGRIRTNVTAKAKKLKAKAAAAAANI